MAKLWFVRSLTETNTVEALYDVAREAFIKDAVAKFHLQCRQDSFIGSSIHTVISGSESPASSLLSHLVQKGISGLELDIATDAERECFMTSTRISECTRPPK